MSESLPRPSEPRSNRRFPLLPLLYLPIALLFLGEAALTGRAYILRDVVTFFHPWQDAVRDSLRAGHLPLWNHASLCGVPLLANLQTGVFYPVNWLYWFLPFDTALTLGMVAHLTIAGVLMRAFLRRVGLANPGAFLGGVLFAFGTWSLSHLEFPMQLGAAVWLPAIWSGVWMAMRGGNPRGLALGGLAAALSFFAGYPQITLYGLISASILALLLLPAALKRPGRGRLRALAWPVILALGLLVAGVQLLPTREMASLSSKAAPYAPAVAMSRSLPPQGLVSLIDPYFQGLPGVDRYWGGDVAEFAFGTFYLGAMALIWIAGSGPGFIRPKRKRRVRREDFAVPRELPVVTPVVTWFLLIGAVTGVLIALGRHTPVYPFLHEHVPGFGRTRWPGAAGYLIAVHLSGLAAIGYRVIARDRERIRRASFAALGLGAAMIGAWALARGPLAAFFETVQTAGAAPWQEAAYAAGRPEWLGALLARGGVVLATGMAGLLLMDIRSRVALAWTVLLVMDLFLTARWFRTPVERGFYDRVPESVARLADDLDGKRLFVPGSTSQLGNFLYGARNVEAFEWAKSTLLCNANMPAGIQAANGCEPLAPRRHEAFFQAFAAETTPWEIKERIFDLWDAGLYLAAPRVRPMQVPSMSGRDDGVVTSKHEPRLGRAMRLNGWRTLAGGPAVLDALFARSHDPAWRTLLEAPPGAAPPALPESPAVSRGESVPYEAGRNSIRVAWQIGDAGMLRVLESWDPGWTATVNGRPVPVYRADFLFLAVPVPAGHCDVSFVYRPRSLTKGAGLSLLGLVGLAVCFLLGRRRGEGEEPLDTDADPAWEPARPASSAQVRQPSSAQVRRPDPMEVGSP